MNISLKQEHELFVSGHNGSDVVDVNFAAFSAPLAVVIFKTVGWVLSANHIYKFTVVKFLTEYVFLVVTVLLAFTCFSDVLIPYYSTLIAIVTTLLFIKFSSAKNKIENIGEEEDDGLNNDREFKKLGLKPANSFNKPSFISVHRSYINVATAICILAVDFKIFPRRFCKTETFGSSLMDVGVGSFVLSNAIVSKEARGLTNRSSLKHLFHTVLSTWPLLLLGLGRSLAVKSVDYHEVVSEYGVHWNFFFTLAFVKIASTFIFVFIPASYSTIISLILCTSYEALLQIFNFSDYLLSDQRKNIIDQNKEGIFSCFGYLSIYMISVSLGRYLFKLNDQGSLWHSMKIKSFYMILMSSTLWTVLMFSCRFVQISRRMANLSYVIWMLAYNVQMITFFFLIDLISIYGSFHKYFHSNDYPKEPNLLAAINSNGLFFFLMSNLITGLINMSYDVIHASDAVAMGILLCYLFVLSFIANLLHSFNIKIKFW